MQQHQQRWMLEEHMVNHFWMSDGLFFWFNIDTMTRYLAKTRQWVIINTQGQQCKVILANMLISSIVGTDFNGFLWFGLHNCLIKERVNPLLLYSTILARTVNMLYFNTYTHYTKLLCVFGLSVNCLQQCFNHKRSICTADDLRNVVIFIDLSMTHCQTEIRKCIKTHETGKLTTRTMLEINFQRVTWNRTAPAKTNMGQSVGSFD